MRYACQFAVAASSRRPRMWSCGMLGVWLCAQCALAVAQSIDVQTPGPHVEVGAGTSSRFIYRDLLVADRASAHVFAGAAGAGFSASLWLTKPTSQSSSYEALLAYSHKLPVIDLHIGIVKSTLGSRQDLSGEFLRVALSNNLSRSTLLNVTCDHPLHGGSRRLSLSLAHELGSYADTRFAVRASSSVWTLDPDRKKGYGLHLNADRALARDAFLNGHLAAIHADRVGVGEATTGLEFGFHVSRQF